MLNEEKYNKVLDNGLILDHYLLLCNIKNGVKIGNNKRIKGFLSLLTKKGYVEKGVLTEKGLSFVENCELTYQVSEEPVKKKPVTVTPKAIDEKWIHALYKKCQDKLTGYTGYHQVKARLGGRSYNFLPNVLDFVRYMNRSITQYKLKDPEAIEKAVLGHIAACKSSGNWFPLMHYYINKDGSSTMVTDMENPVGQSEDKQFDIKSTKDLFDGGGSGTEE